MRGLPIGHGVVWHDPAQKRWLLALAVGAMLPFVALAAPGWGLVSMTGYWTLLVTPLVALLAGGIGFVAVRYPEVARRVAIGACAGLLGALTYDTLRLVGEGFGWVSAGAALGLPAVGAGEPVSPMAIAESTVLRWGLLGSLWGVAYALVAGKARWAYGAAFGLLMGALTLVGIAMAPHGAGLAAGFTWAGVVGWLVGTALYGAVLGALNEALQPDVRRGAKIVFLRDYQTRLPQRK